MKKYVNYELEAGLAIVTIDNPPVNALTKETCNELLSVFKELKNIEIKNEKGEKSRVKVVILAAADHKGVFIAGADINMFLDLKTREDGEKLGEFCHEVMDPIAEFEAPVICAINGLALGGGTEISLACDIRIASENAEFGLTEVTLGVIPGGGGTQRLSRLIGAGKAKEMIFSGRRINVQEAFRMGLVERVVPRGEALNEAKQIAKQILKNSPSAVKHAKMAIDKGLNVGLAEGLKIERTALGLTCASGEQREGAQAFLEKRKPEF